MKTNQARLFEFIGVIAVVLSLLFVGMQLMFDRRVAMGEQYFNRAEARRADIRSRIESDAYMSDRVNRWENGDRPGW